MKIEEVITKFMGSGNFRKLKPLSQSQYISGLKTFEDRFSGRDIESIRRAEIVSFNDEMADSPGKAFQFVKATSVLFSYALDMEFVHANPCYRIKMQKMTPIPRWSVDQIKKVIAINHRTVRTAVALSWYTGQRQGDVLSMKWSDITDGDTLNVVQSKTGQKMQIKIHPSLKKILDSIEDKGEYIVSKDRRIHAETFRSCFKLHTRKIGIDLPFHGIRKTVAATLAENGRSANEIAALLGHTTLSMVTLYTKDANAKKMIASAVDSMD
jgi:hypothetical protein